MLVVSWTKKGGAWKITDYVGVPSTTGVIVFSSRTTF
jgi:hypothetical protein